MQELIYAYKSGVLRDDLHKFIKDLFDSIEASCIEIVPVNKNHLLEYTH